MTLPKVCAWYAADFTNKANNNDDHLIVVIWPLLSEEHRRSLRDVCGGGFEDIMLDFDRVKIRYAPYEFECRRLELLDDDWEYDDDNDNKSHTVTLGELLFNDDKQNCYDDDNEETFTIMDCQTKPNRTCCCYSFCLIYSNCLYLNIL